MKNLQRSEVGEVLARIYESELDFRLESEWDNGYYFFIGNAYDRYTGGKYYGPTSNKIEDVISELAFRLTEKYPESEFASYWQKRQVLAPELDWTRDADPSQLDDTHAAAEKHHERS